MMLLLLVAISAVSVIYFQVLSDKGPTPHTIVKIVGKGEGEYIYLEHMGGEDIDINDEIIYTIIGTSSRNTIGNLIYNNRAPLDFWNVGETLKLPIGYDVNNLDQDQIAEITGIDLISNSIIFHGPITLPEPVSDVGVSISIFDTDGAPIRTGDTLLINITVTSYGGNVDGSGNVTVCYQMPEGLNFVSSFSPTGHNDYYNPITGYWNVGNIMAGYENRSILTITVTVNESLGRAPTQLAMLIDGSGSIDNNWFDWFRTSDRAHNEVYSIKSDENHRGDFICNDLNTSGANSIIIDFWYRLDDTEDEDLKLYYYDGNDWDLKSNLGGGTEDTWLHYSHTVTDQQYLKDNFKIKFDSNINSDRENIWIDDVSISTNINILLDDGFEGIWWKWHANWQPSDWDLIRIGMANAILNSSVFPHDSSVELTILQFGGSSYYYGRTWAQVELNGPEIINQSNYQSIADSIPTISQLGGGTAMSCAFRLAGDVISGDPNNYLYGTSEQGMESSNSDWERQIVILVTDGQPNGIYDHNDRYGGWWAGLIDGEDYQFVHGKNNSEIARDYLINLLNLNSTNDEINSLAIGNDPDINWLNESIVWPNNNIWDINSEPVSNPGWVAHIDSFEQFESAISEMFKSLFSIQNTVNFVSSKTFDPNDFNNHATVTIS